MVLRCISAVAGAGHVESTCRSAPRRQGFTALVVTIDTGVPGLRERDWRNEHRRASSARGAAGIRILGQMIARRAWVAGLLLDGGADVVSQCAAAEPKDGRCHTPIRRERRSKNRVRSAGTISEVDTPSLGRKDTSSRACTQGGSAARRRALPKAATRSSFSNHGGRQLDGVPGSIRSLPEVVAAAGNKIEVLVDGGIRNGGGRRQGAGAGREGCCVGRAYAYGLAAAGEPGRGSCSRNPSHRHRADDEAAGGGVGPRSEPLGR